MLDNTKHYCVQCCAEVDPDVGEYCQECGKKHSVHYHQSYELPAGTYLRDGRYFVGKSIGTGGFGISYIGYDIKLERKVLVKEIYYSDFCTRNVGSNNITERLRVKYNNQISIDEIIIKTKQECRNLAEAEDLDNVVKIYDWFLENNTAYIVMEFINGWTLSDRISEKGKYSWNELYPKIEPLIKSLACLHEKGIIHRDIKPENIMIKKVFHNEEKFILIDFGLARFYNQMTKGIAFTPCYSPEEQRTKIVEDGFYTDVYSLAATMYYALTGKSPNNKNTRDRKKIFPELECMIEKYGVPGHVVDALSYALVIDYSSRCQSMEEFLELLSPKQAEQKPKDKPELQPQPKPISAKKPQPPQNTKPKIQPQPKPVPEKKPQPPQNTKPKVQPQPKPVPEKKPQPPQNTNPKVQPQPKPVPEKKPQPPQNTNPKVQPQQKSIPKKKKQPHQKNKFILRKYILPAACLCICFLLTFFLFSEFIDNKPVPVESNNEVNISNIQFKEDVINVFINRNQGLDINYSSDNNNLNSVLKQTVYTSDDETIASISSDGMVRGKNLGSTTVRLQCKTNNTITDECIVNVVDTEQLQKNIYNDYLNEIIDNSLNDENYPVNSIIKDFDNDGNFELAVIDSSDNVDVFQINSEDNNLKNVSKDDVLRVDDGSEIYNYAVYHIKQVKNAKSDNYIEINQTWNGKISYDLLSDGFVDTQKQHSVSIISDDPDIISVEDNTVLKANKIGSTFLTVKTNLNSAASARIRADVLHTEDGKKLVEYSKSIEPTVNTGCSVFSEAKLIGKKFDYFYDYNLAEYVPMLLLRYDYGNDVRAIHCVRSENNEKVHYAAYDSANDFVPYKEKNDYYNNVLLLGNDTGAVYIESLSYDAQNKKSEHKIFSIGEDGNMELVIAFKIINKNEYYVNNISYSQSDYEKEFKSIDEKYTVWKDWEKP